jgi:hypothetical protein
VFSNRGDVLDRMCDSIFVPDGCCGNSCFNPREGFEQLLMSALIFWAVEVDIGGRRGLVVKAADWLSLDRQFEPYPRANTVAPSWCGLGCRSRTLMVAYISPWF